MSSPYEAIRAQMGAAVPFAAHVGVELTEISDGAAAARLAQTETSVNHIGTQHAGALFTLGEAASGGAMAGAFAPVLLGVRPVAARAEIAYERIAKGTVTATARTSEPGATLLERLEAEGRVVFDVMVTLRDAEDRTVATMQVAWHVSKPRPA